MTERDKWGRIPATLVEIDQPLCALKWGEGRCRAGLPSNLQVYSRSIADGPIWETSGSIFGDSRNSEPYNPIKAVLIAEDGGYFTVPSGNYASLPVFSEPQALTFSAEYVPSSVSGRQFRISAEFVTAQSASPVAVGFDFNNQTFATSSVSPEVTNIQFEEIGIWTRVSFSVDTSLITSSAYSVYIGVLGKETGSTDFVRFAQPQISNNGLNDFSVTDDEVKLSDPQPCFNTLSSCQSLETYTTTGLHDGLLLAGSNDTITYTSGLSGRRQDGIFLTFYLKVTGRNTSSGADKFIDIGGLLTVSYEYDTSVSPNDRIIFANSGGSVVRELTETPGTTYKIAAYLSAGGTLQVKGVSSPGSVDSIPGPPAFVEIEEVSAAKANLVISDVVVYDYLPEQISGPSVADKQKGDRFGDAILYAPLTEPFMFSSASGEEPAVTFEDEKIGIGRLNYDGGDAVLLEGVGLTDLIEPPLTLRFSERSKSSRLPETLSAIPSLVRASNEPAKLSVGGTNDDISALGSRDRLTAEFEDHPYSDILTDPYRDQRTYDPELQGTFWGKWFARNVYKEGFPIRYVSGYETEAGAFERTNEYNYIIEKGNGPDARGRAVIKGFDILQSLRADKAVYPEPSSGRLSADISDTATSMTLQPVGVGSEYPSGSFRVRVGGEGMDVTRSGDTLTINTRGLYGGADSHSEDDTVQVVARIQSHQVHDIAYDIITSAVPELARNIPKDRWNGLASEYLPRLYSADITEPTGVEDLLAELTQTAPIYFYADVRTNLIELGVIREPTSVAVELGPDNALLAGKMDIKEFPKERIDEVWVYYRIRDAAEAVDDPNNYSQRFILVNPEEQQRRGRRSIKRIYTRWIVAGARDTAEEIAQAYISRFQNQPVRVSFDLDAKRGDIWLGDVVKLLAPQKQTVTGETRIDINYQVIEAQESNPGHQFSYMAQSYEFFAPVSPDELTITIQPEDTVDGTGAVDQIDLRELYDSVVATEIDDITFIVAGGPGQTGGAIVGGGTGQSWSMNIPNNWPWSPSITLRVEPGAVITGRGGDGGEGAEISGNTPEDGENGQTGLLVGYAISLDNSGIIGGGGGGGGGSACDPGAGGAAGFISGGGGGGGAGRKPGGAGPRGSGFDGAVSIGVVDAEPGDTLTGGAGGYAVDGRPISPVIYYRGGRGGDMAQAGSPGETAGGVSGGAGGLPGAAIDGVSNITFINRGDIRGTEIN